MSDINTIKSSMMLDKIWMLLIDCKLNEIACQSKATEHKSNNLETVFTNQWNTLNQLIKP
jgi:hypothetical protein